MNDTILLIIVGYFCLTATAMLIHDRSHRDFLRLQHRSYMESLYALSTHLDSIVQENKQLREQNELLKRTAAAQDLSVYDEVEV